MWFGIIVFAMSNGFLLMPVILSFIGPVNTKEKKNTEQPKPTEIIVAPASKKEPEGSSQEDKVSPKDGPSQVKTELTGPIIDENNVL